MILPKTKEWIVVNHVFSSETNRLYGYKLRNKASETKIITIKTGNMLLDKKAIEESLYLELSHITVPGNFKEEIEGLL